MLNVSAGTVLMVLEHIPIQMAENMLGRGRMAKRKAREHTPGHMAISTLGIERMANLTAREH